MGREMATAKDVFEYLQSLEWRIEKLEAVTPPKERKLFIESGEYSGGEKRVKVPFPITKANVAASPEPWHIDDNTVIFPVRGFQTYMVVAQEA